MNLPRLRRRLLAWFDAHARPLPWRRTRDWYPIWISEVMLQQTTVAAVIPYFHRFLERFPTVGDLAAAPRDDVLRLWEGLGYYSRARNLHAAAQAIVESHGGELPTAPHDVGDLPGFGRYTTNAVLSQAFDQKLPILEANSVRLLCRLFAVDDDPRESKTRERLWELAESLLPGRRVGDFNQALMELGSLVCAPSGPKCETCPLDVDCQARLTNRQGEIPRRTPRPTPTLVREAAVVMRRGDKVFIVQRPATGRWAHLWEFPRCVVNDGQTPPDALDALLRSLGFRADVGAELTTIRHGVTRFRITLVCHEATRKSGEFQEGVYPAGVWVPPCRLGEFPVSRPQRMLADLVQAGMGDG